MPKLTPIASLCAVIPFALLSGCSSSSAPAQVLVAISPAQASVFAGKSQAFNATVTGASNTAVVWSVMEGSAGGAITAAGVYTAPSAPGTFHVVATAAADSSASATAAVTVSAVAGASITVAPASASIAAGETQQFTAQEKFNDGTTQDITATATWTSSDAAVLAFSATPAGLAQGLKAGSATVSAAQDGLAGEATATVGAAVLTRLAISAGTPRYPIAGAAGVELYAGDALQWSAQGLYSDGTTADLTLQTAWTSANNSVVTFEGIGGAGDMQSLEAGATTISASAGGQQASATVTVDPPRVIQLTFDPAMPSVAAGDSVSLTAYGLLTNGSTTEVTNLVTFQTSDPSIATVSLNTVTSLKAGMVDIVATYGGATPDGLAVTGDVPLTVTAAELRTLTVTPASATALVGKLVPFHALGGYSDGSSADLTTSATWDANSNGNAVSISNITGSQGVAEAFSFPSTPSTIKATVSGLSATATLNTPHALGVAAFFGTSSKPYGVTLADLNGDGKLDVVTGNDDGDVSVLLGKGDGTFAAAVNYPVGFEHGDYVAIGDVTGDGKVDLVVAGFGVAVLKGNGDGTFAAPVQLGDAQGLGLALADLNGDGHLDVVLGGAVTGRNNPHDGKMTILINNGDGTFAAPVDYAVDGDEQENSVLIADFNGDGQPDVALAPYNTAHVAVFLNQGHGTFGTVNLIATAAGSATLDVGDINGDGNVDIVTSNVNNTATESILLGNGDGTFQPHADLTAPVANNVALRDLDGDGLLDLLALQPPAGVVRIALGEGDGVFGPEDDVEVSFENESFGSAWGDVNGDGKLDLVTTSIGSDLITVQLNTSP